MKTNGSNFYSADERLVAAFGRLLLNHSNLAAFYSTTLKSLEIGKSNIEKEWNNAMHESTRTPEFEKIRKKNPLFESQDFINGISQAMSGRSMRLAKQTVESAALVFAHSLLDDSLSECCVISFVANPTDWYPFIQKRKVEIGSLQAKSNADLLEELAWDFLQQQKRESMLKRLTLLNQICIPRLKTKEVPTAWLKREELEEFDSLRHRIIHGRYFSRPIRAIEDRLHFAKTAGFSALMLVWSAYGTFGKKMGKPKSEFRMLRLCAILRREFPEFRELFENLAEKK